MVKSANTLSYRAQETWKRNSPKPEPAISLLMRDVVFVTKLPRRHALLESLRLCGSPILVRAADVERPAIPSA
jgi:hypothetical protein